MAIFMGYFIKVKKATSPDEAKLWCNTIDGNRHQRIVALERVISHDGITGYMLCLGKYQWQWAKMRQRTAHTQ